MKLLLDECIDKGLAKHFKGYTVKTVPQNGWAGLKNGKLLSLAEKNFDIFITVDRNLSSQQNLSRYNIAVLVLSSTSNRLQDLEKLVPKILTGIRKISKGQTITIGEKE